MLPKFFQFFFLDSFPVITNNHANTVLFNIGTDADYERAFFPQSMINRIFYQRLQSQLRNLKMFRYLLAINGTDDSIVVTDIL